MNFCIFYEFGIGRSCRRRSPYVLREPDCGAFAVCKVKRPAVICGGLQGDIGMYGAFFNRLTACCFHSSGPVAGGIFYSRDRISSSVEPFAEASFSVRMRFSRFFTESFSRQTTLAISACDKCMRTMQQ